MPPTTSNPSSPSRQPVSRAPSRAATIDPVRVLRQHWKTIVMWAVAGIFVSGAFQLGAAVVFPIYSGQVVLRLRSQLGDAKEIFGETTPQEETVARLAQTEAQQMISRDILVRAMTHRDILTTKWHEYFLDDDGQFIIDEAVDDLEDDISAGHRRGTQFFAIYWAAHVASDVPTVLNTIVDTYLKELRSESERKFNSTEEVFVRQQEELDKRISEMKSSVRRFITEQNIPSFEEDSSQTQRGVEELARRIAETTMDLSLVKSQRNQLNAKLEGRLEASEDDVRRAEGDPVLLQLGRDINDMTVGLESKKHRFGPDHPEIRASMNLLASGLAQKEKVLADIVKRDLNAQFKTVSDRQSGLEDLLKQQTADHAFESKRVQELASRVADLEAMKDQQLQLESERNEITKTIGDLRLASVRKDSIPVDISQKSLTPRELAFPNWKIVLPGVWLAVIAMGIGVIFLREFLDQRVRFAADLAGLTSGKMLGVIPDLADDESKPQKVEFVVRDAPQSAMAESLRQISTNMSKAIDGQDAKVVGVFCAMPEAGVTAIISNLASSAAVVGKRVLIIDANFRKPAVARCFALSEQSQGFGDVLAGTVDFSNAIQTAGRGIDVMVAGNTRTLEMFDTLRATEVFNSAREKYDLVLVDTAPAAIAAESIVIANRVDAAVLVVRAMSDQRGLVTRLLAQLQAQRAQFVGAILNRPQQTAGGYYKKNARIMTGYVVTSSTPTPAQGAA
ncbi:MAG: hypothetical protein EXS17_04415 [Phycisphaerales bacterium]|nr:hypothetical protein [Phycisphaerales bacterium]